MNKWHVYGLKDPRDGRIRYVGITRDRQHRMAGHRARPKKGSHTPKELWVTELKALGLEPEMIILESGAELLEGNQAERRWILTLHADGSLTNVAIPPPARGWRQLNIPVEDSVYHAAKVASARAGMLFRKWVERAILDACEGSDFRRPGETDRYQPSALRQTKHVAFEDL